MIVMRQQGSHAPDARAYKTVTGTNMAFLQLAFASQAVVFVCIVVAFRLAGFVAQKWYDYLVVNERAESMENKSSATTATVLKPLASLLPLLGYLVAFQRFFAGMLAVPVTPLMCAHLSHCAWSSRACAAATALHLGWICRCG
jgi:C4-dicarboxylate transporter